MTVVLLFPFFLFCSNSGVNVYVICQNCSRTWWSRLININALTFKTGEDTVLCEYAINRSLYHLQMTECFELYPSPLYPCSLAWNKKLSNVKSLRRFTPYFFDKQHLDKLIGHSVDHYYHMLIHARRMQRHSQIADDMSGDQPEDDPDGLMDPPEVFYTSISLIFLT